MLTALDFIQEFRGGSSLPALVRADDGNRYVVKPKGSGEGPISGIIEYITGTFAQHIGIVTPRLHLIIIEDSFHVRAAKDETQDLLKRSVGINICADYIENSEPYIIKQHRNISQSERDMIFLFDVLMLNIDRTVRNPNMLVHDNILHCIDYGSSITVRNILEKTSLNNEVFLSPLRVHPFYTECINPDVCTHIQNTIMQYADSITGSIPDELLFSFGDISETRNRIKKEFYLLGQNTEKIIEERLHAIHKIIPMNDEERKLKRIRSVNSFFARVQELNKNNL